MSFWSKLRRFVKKVAPYVLPVVAIVAPQLIPAIGQALGATNAVAASAMGSAVISGGTAAAAGEDIGKAALQGAAAGATGELVKGSFSEAASQTDPLSKAAQVQYPGQAPDLTLGQKISQGVQGLGGSPELGTAVSAGVGSAASGTAGGLAAGQDLGEALKTGAKSGVVGGGTSYLSQQLFPTMPTSAGQNFAREATETGIGYGLSSLFQPSAKTGTTYDVSMTGMPSGGAGSQALAQALRLGDPGAPLFGSEKEGKRKNVWNVASLKVKDETGA